MSEDKEKESSWKTKNKNFVDSLIPIWHWAHHSPTVGPHKPPLLKLDKSDNNQATLECVRGGQRNTEIFFNYGDCPNAEWLAVMGFCLEDNPHDVVDLRLRMKVCFSGSLCSSTLSSGSRHSPTTDIVRTIARQGLAEQIRNNYKLTVDGT